MILVEIWEDDLADVKRNLLIYKWYKIHFIDFSIILQIFCEYRWVLWIIVGKIGESRVSRGPEQTSKQNAWE